MPRKKPNEAELIAARGARKRTELMNRYRVQPRELDGEWWVFLVITLAYIRVDLPLGHVANESLAQGFVSRIGGPMLDALLEYQAKQEQKNREDGEKE